MRIRARGTARGEYLVIYDAEDRPEPDQLKKATVAFLVATEHLDKRAPQRTVQ